MNDVEGFVRIELQNKKVVERVGEDKWRELIVLNTFSTYLVGLSSKFFHQD